MPIAGAKTEVIQSAGEGAKRELAKRHLKLFCSQMNPHYISARHADAIIHNLEALERRDIDRLMIFMPPRHGKTMHVSELFPAWFEGRRDGRAQIILSSYAANKAYEASRRCRDLLKEDSWPWRGEIALREDSVAVDRWGTNRGGVVIAAGVGGGITGFGAHFLNIDDPFKDRAEADSPTRRQEIYDWYTDVAKTRLMPKGVQLITNTRWNDDDLCGRLLNSPGAFRWTILSLPAIAIEADVPDLIGRMPGEPLWPECYPVEALEDFRETMSASSWAAQYQCNPVPAEGAIFKAEWFKNFYDPSDLLDKDNRMRPMVVIQSVDSAWRTGVKNDFSVIATWGYDGKNFYLLDMWRGKLEYPELKRQVVDTFNKQPVTPSGVYCEDTASGLALVTDLKRTTGIPIIGVPTKNEKKEPRAERVTPFFEAGRVLLPRNAPWLNVWVEEHLRFPAGTHDDMVDSSSLALGKLGQARRKVGGDQQLFGWMQR